MATKDTKNDLVIQKEFDYLAEQDYNAYLEVSNDLENYPLRSTKRREKFAVQAREFFEKAQALRKKYGLPEPEEPQR
ncbi:MAG TPA: hypothetical protein PLM07_01795 [Candidatus Rifleibacterium sp.]|nr:hypothetical protein [Candidatus Rifleibacterium sp.]HPT44612.1 hypothetical protein [Candidatus Rifleibacterium sp.]